MPTNDRNQKTVTVFRLEEIAGVSLNVCTHLFLNFLIGGAEQEERRAREESEKSEGEE